MIYKNIFEYDGFKISFGKKIYHGCKLFSHPLFKDLNIERIVIDKETKTKIYLYVVYILNGSSELRLIRLTKVKI